MPLSRTLAVSMFLASLPAVARAEPTKEACVASYDSSQKLRLDGKLVAAHKELLVCASEACPSIVRQDCLGWLREVEVLLPTVIFAARDASGEDVVDVTVTVDGVVVRTSLDGKAVSIDPGPHVVRFVRGETVVEQKVVVVEGEKGRIVRVTLASSPASKPAQQGEPALDRPTPTATLVLGGIGVAALATGGFLAWSGSRDLRNLRETCAPSCAQSDVDATRTKLRIGDAALAVGVISIGVAVALYVTRPSQPKEPPVQVSLLPGGAFFGFVSRF